MRASGRTDHRALAAALAAVLVVGFMARARVSLLPAMIPGDDGAYYFVQVRAILRDGRLAFPDFPLVFYLQAGIAWLLSLVMDTRAAIVAAVRWTDAILPVALAVPVYLFVRALWPADRSRGHPLLAMVLTGLIAVASGNALLTAGGMTKNATALPLSLLFVFYLYRALQRGERRAAGLAALCCTLSAMTHVGGLVLDLTIGVLVVALGMLAPPTRARLLRPALVVLACLAGVSLLVRVIDPPHAMRLLNAVVHPGWLVAGSAVSQWLHGVSGRAVDEVMTSEEIWLGAALGLIGLYVLWRYRAVMDAATRVVLAAATLTTLLFITPILRPDVLERLALIAFVPGLVPVAYLIHHERWGAALVTPIVALVLLSGGLAVKTLRVTGFVRPAYDELRRLKGVLPPGRTIVITRHGLEWWVAWTMETHISNWVGRALVDRDRYRAVLVLDEIGPGAFGIAHYWPIGGAPGAALSDGERLRQERVTPLATGQFFRLSQVREPETPPATVWRAGFPPARGPGTFRPPATGASHGSRVPRPLRLA
jgi:hypothetical protein